MIKKNYSKIYAMLKMCWWSANKDRPAVMG